MTDKKYTDEEIIKALECHFNEELDEEPFRCVDCSLYNDTSPSCTEALKSYALDLINRQKSEIEKLRFQKDFECKKAVCEFAKQIRGEIEKAYESNLKAKRERMDNQKRPLTNLDNVYLADIDGKMNALSGLDLFIEKLMEGA